MTRSFLVLGLLTILQLGLNAAKASAQGAPATTATTVSPVQQAFDMDATVEAARQTVRQFSERLRTELAAAIKSDGAANAVPLCQTLAPDLTMGLSDQSGFEVLRTSLRLRNPENAAGARETEALLSFEKQMSAGTDPGKLEQFEVVTTAEGDRQFRYMKGIVAGEMCLACHGTEVKPDVRAELTRYYPDDKATGYRSGDLRGAFVLLKFVDR